MPSFNPQTVITRDAQQSRIWLAHDDRRGEWITEVIVRQREGIRHLVNRYAGARPTFQTLRQDARRHGVVSPRPYQLGQFCDGSITTCVVALFENFCRARQLDAMALLHQAYPDRVYTLKDLDATRRHADWEGTAYPAQWDRTAIDGLLESLNAVNYRSLRDIVEEMTEGTELQGLS
jgi:hypothetical protein